MTVVTDLDLPMFDLFDPVVVESLPTELDALLRQGAWLVRTPLWVSVIEHDAVRDLQRDPRLHTMGTSILHLQGVTDGLLHEWMARLLLNVEGPDHTRQRRLVSRAFTPRAVERLRPMMRAYVEARVQPISERGGGDLVAELAEAYPIAVICELVGAPAEDWPKFSAWASQIFKMFNFNLAEDLPLIEAAITELEAYLEALIDHRRSSPDDDLLSELLAVEEEGDRLSHRELIDLVSALLLAGTDTTRNQLGLGMLHLARDPEQWRRLVEDPALVPQAVEEILRFEPTVAATPRVTVEDVDYRGVTFPTGTMVALLNMSANRDPKVVSCPMDFDVAADRGTWPSLSFGSGPHYCLGANLARAELIEALAVLVRSWETITLDHEPEMKPLLGIIGPLTLPLTVTPR